MEKIRIANQDVTVWQYNTLIVGAGAAGMNCAVHLHEFMRAAGVRDAHDRIAVVTAGIGLGASRMSGSDKQTYYKMGTSPGVADSAEEFASSLTAAGCCHGDLALVEAVCSLPEFYHLVRAGVPFPHDRMGSYIGYKTDHDPYERATSAGPRTSRFMSERMQGQVEHWGIQIHDNREAVELLTAGPPGARRIIGIVTIDTRRLAEADLALNVYLCENLVLAAGGPGALYKTSVYPEGQVGIHGLALEAGLVAENLTESQFGLASTRFRWNVSGSYMQAIPRIFSTDNELGDERDFLADFFTSMSTMATAVFLKGYQWPFDPQRIRDFQSSLIDVLVFNEAQKGRRVFLDFSKNPVASNSMDEFSLDSISPEARSYLEKTGALQETPIERLAHMNTPAIEIFADAGIDLYGDPLEIALCAQHNNGGFAVDLWWQSNIPHVFVIGEMAATHGVKRPGGSALNAGQVGGLRAAEYIAKVYGPSMPPQTVPAAVNETLEGTIAMLDACRASAGGLDPARVIDEIQQRMTASAGHLRGPRSARRALGEAVRLHREIQSKGFAADAAEIPLAVQARHLALASAAYLKAIVELLAAGSGSRGSHIVLDDEGDEIHADVIDKSTGKPLRFKPENTALRNTILQLRYEGDGAAGKDPFLCEQVPVREARVEDKAFEVLWREFREGNIYS